MAAFGTVLPYAERQVTAELRTRIAAPSVPGEAGAC
jgi:hypothetical protein